MLGIYTDTETAPKPAPEAKVEAKPKPKEGLDGYLDYLGIPKQEYANEPVTDEPISSDPFPDDTANQPPEDNTRPNGFNPDSYYEPSEIKTMENNIEFSMIPAESLVEVVDMGMTKGAELIAKEKQEGATDDEKERLTKIWALFLAGKNANISPGWMLLAMIIIIYAPKFYGAYQIRKAKEEAAEAKARAEAARKRAEKAEAEAARLRKQQEETSQHQYVQYEVVDDVTANAQPVAAPAPEAPKNEPKTKAAPKKTTKTTKK